MCFNKYLDYMHTLTWEIVLDNSKSLNAVRLLLLVIIITITMEHKGKSKILGTILCTNLRANYT